MKQDILLVVNTPKNLVTRILLLFAFTILPCDVFSMEFVQFTLNGITYRNDVISAPGYAKWNYNSSDYPQAVRVYYNSEYRYLGAIVTIPDEVTYNGVTYPVVEIGHNAFLNCERINKITIGENVKVICNGAFNGCTYLNTIILPSSLLTAREGVVYGISGGSFSGCDRLHTVVCNSSIPPSVYECPFPSASKARLFVPTGSVQTYKNNNNWKPFGSIVSLNNCHDHSFAAPSWNWTEKDKATVTFTCSTSGCGYSFALDAKVSTSTKTAATCTTMGTHTYSATVTITGTNSYINDHYVQDINALGHDYNTTPTWTWISDGSSATAQFTCSRNSSHKENVAATNITNTVQIAPTCTVKGTTRYTATVTRNSTDYKSNKDVQDINALGHSWTYTDKDNTSHTKTCSRCNSTSTENHTLENGICTLCFHGSTMNGNWSYSTTGSGTWYIDANGTLTIKGTGVIGNYKDYPWFTYRNMVKKIVVDGSFSSISLTYSWRGDVRTGFPNVTNVELKGSIETISDYCFCDFSSLKTITLPATITSVSTSAFGGCSSLESITLPNSVTSLGKYAFGGCSNLSSIVLSDDITYIQDNTFKNCKSLTSVTLPNKLQAIGANAFENCTSLSSITFPDALTYVGDYAFKGCENIESITIPKNVSNIGNGAFVNCGGIVVDADNVSYDSRDNCNAIMLKGSGTLKCGCKSTVIPASADYISYYAFSGCKGLTSVNMPSSVTEVSQYAFEGCTDLLSVSMPNVKHIDNNAFKGCGKLNSVSFPQLLTVGDFAFADCSSLAPTSLPETLYYVGRDVFSNTKLYNDALEGLVYCGDVLCDYKGEFPEDYEPVINEGTRVIATGSFGYNGLSYSYSNKVKKLLLPNSVKSVCGFYEYGNLSEVSFPENLEYLDFWVGESSNIHYSPWYKNVEKPDVWYIGKILVRAKNNGGEQPEATMYVKDGTTQVCWRAFYDADNDYTSVRNIILPEMLKYYKSDSYNASIELNIPHSVKLDASCEFNTQTLHLVQDDPCRLGSFSKIPKAYVPYNSLEKYRIKWEYKLSCNEVKELIGVKKGDVNLDESVDVTDAVAIIENVVLGNSTAGFSRPWSNINEDNAITIADALAVVNIILGEPVASSSKAMKRSEIVRELDFTWRSSNELQLSLLSNEEFSACQFDLVLPDGIQLSEAILDDNMNGGFTLQYCERAPGVYSVAVYNFDGKRITSGSVPFLAMTTKGSADGQIRLTNIHFSTPSAFDVSFKDMTLDASATSIVDVNCDDAKNDVYYDLSGLKIKSPKKGLYILNNKKIVVK